MAQLTGKELKLIMIFTKALMAIAAYFILSFIEWNWFWYWHVYTRLAFAYTVYLIYQTNSGESISK